MTGFKKSITLALCLAPIALSACGEGWVAVYSSDTFPYGNERTAGSGVTYVRESMLPAKELNIEPPAEIVEPAPAVEPEPAPMSVKEPDVVHDAFMDAQAK